MADNRTSQDSLLLGPPKGKKLNNKKYHTERIVIGQLTASLFKD